jgi:drug/metabolite transporter (DMT)-like permease
LTAPGPSHNPATATSPNAAQPAATGVVPFWLSIAALVFNAFVWGVSWWPFRQLQALGLHPLWATALIYLVTVLVITAWQPGAWRQLASTPSLWPLMLAAGTTNATFNWGVTEGDVVRVVLLFYLMPLWAVLLARWLLHEKLTALALLRVALALLGAAVVLWPQGSSGASLPLPRNLPEALGVLGGFTFALNNVMLKRESHRPAAARALAMFLGGAVVAGGVAGVMSWQGQVPTPPPVAWGWVLGALALGLGFLAGNLALQKGASHLPANITAVVMITEVLFASVSAVWLGAGSITPGLMLGGLLIVAAALLSSLESRATVH